MPRDPDALPAVKGESRPSTNGFTYSYDDSSLTRSKRRRPFGQRSSARARSDDSDPPLYTEAHTAPDDIDTKYKEYFIEFPFVQAALTIFEDEVVEPGWNVVAHDEDGDVDDQMTEALEYWGKHCAVDAGNRGQDILSLIEQLPSRRRTKPGQFIELAGTQSDPDALAALMPLDPSTMEIWTHRNKPLIVHPDDAVGDKHPMAERGDEEYPAGYVQYAETPSINHGENSWSNNATGTDEQIAFTADEVLKLTYKAPPQSPWGRTIWPAIEDHIDGLTQKLRDRNAAIRLTGWPHRMYIGENWDPEFARKLASMHKEGDVSAWNDDQGREEKSYAGRNDFLPGGNGDIETEVVSGEVPDISGAIKDDIEGIFSILPVSKFKIAYEESINQFVVEPQMEKDDRYIDSEQRYLRRQFEPLFTRKANELAPGDEHAGEVRWELKQPESDNPLERSDFDAERLSTVIDSFAGYARADADAVFGKQLPFWLANMDPDELGEAMEVLDAIVNEEGQRMEEAAEETGMPEVPPAGDDS